MPANPHIDYLLHLCAGEVAAAARRDISHSCGLDQGRLRAIDVRESHVIIIPVL